MNRRDLCIESHLVQKFHSCQRRGAQEPCQMNRTVLHFLTLQEQCYRIKLAKTFLEKSVYSFLLVEFDKVEDFLVLIQRPHTEIGSTLVRNFPIKSLCNNGAPPQVFGNFCCIQYNRCRFSSAFTMFPLMSH